MISDERLFVNLPELQNIARRSATVTSMDALDKKLFLGENEHGE